MRVTDRDPRPECHVIPFHRPEAEHEAVEATSIAAVIAVTVLHSADESPEDRLLEILERSGDVEVLDAEDAMEELDPGFESSTALPANDNARLATI